MRLIGAILITAAVYLFAVAAVGSETSEDWQQLLEDIEVLPEYCPDFSGRPQEINDEGRVMIIRQARILSIQFEGFGLPQDRVKELAGAVAFYETYKSLCNIF